MAHKLRRPTMNDVAHASGVSLKSVSRVINGEVGASPETREKVLQAAAKLGYRRNDAAHALRRSDGRSASVGLVLEDVSNPFAAALNRSVERVAGEQGSLVLAVSTNADPDREENLVHRLLARAVDALIVMSCRRDHAFLQPELDRGMPIIFVDRPPRRLACPTVRVANSKAAHDATAHLIAHGHHRVAFLGDRPSLYTADERQRGYVRALHEAGLPSDPDLQWRGQADAGAGSRGRYDGHARPGGSADGGVRREQLRRHRRAHRAAAGEGRCAGPRWWASTTWNWRRSSNLH